jgi:tRNA A37 methylthiotransferase MiaB
MNTAVSSLFRVPVIQNMLIGHSCKQYYAGDAMKTLVVRPGSEIVEKTFRGPWPPGLNHLERLYREPGEFCRGVVQHAIFSHSSSLAVGTLLNKMGEDVEYLDVPLEFGLPLTEELNEQKGEKIAEYIARGGYDVVGISCTFALEGVATKRVANAAKNALEDVTVVVGGYQAASVARDMMEKTPSIDVVVLSDFEPIAELLYQSFEGTIPVSSVPNILYRENGTICGSERIPLTVTPEDLPVYDYSLVKKYLPKYAVFVVEASRGCPYQCTFCQEKVLRHLHTVKDANVVVEETIDTANYVAQTTDHVTILYCDALWGVNPQWVKDFCLQLAERKDEITSSGFGWFIEGRVGQFDAEALSLMKKAGCIAIAYGVESLSSKMLNIMNKTRNTQKYIASVFDTAERTTEAGIHAALLFLLGMPGETPSTLEETLTVMKRLPLEKENLHVKFGLPAILHGTLLDKQIHDPQFVEEHGVRLLGENDWEKGYFPRHTLLFDPSRELSASEMTDFFLDIVGGTRGIPASLEKQFETHKEVRAVLDQDEISADNLVRLGRFLDFSGGWPDGSEDTVE